MGEDLLYHRPLVDEADDLHLSSAFGTSDPAAAGRDIQVFGHNLLY